MLEIGHYYSNPLRSSLISKYLILHKTAKHIYFLEYYSEDWLFFSHLLNKVDINISGFIKIS